MQRSHTGRKKIDVSDSGWVRKYHRSGAIAALRFSVSQSHFKTEKIRLQHERCLVGYVFLTQLDRPQSWPQFEYVRIKSAACPATAVDQSISSTILDRLQR